MLILTCICLIKVSQLESQFSQLRYGIKTVESSELDSQFSLGNLSYCKFSQIPCAGLLLLCLPHNIQN